MSDEIKYGKICDAAQMHGICEVCGKENQPLIRTYFHYDGIKCECHSPNHFILVDHCKDCIPKEPIYQKVEFKTEDLKNPIKLLKRLQKEAFESNYFKEELIRMITDQYSNGTKDHQKASIIANNIINFLLK